MQCLTKNDLASFGSCRDGAESLAQTIKLREANKAGPEASLTTVCG